VKRHASGRQGFLDTEVPLLLASSSSQVEAAISQLLATEVFKQKIPAQ